MKVIRSLLDTAASKSTTRASSAGLIAMARSQLTVRRGVRGAVVYCSFFTQFAHADDDGEKESHVKERYIKKRSSSRSRSRSRSRSPKRSKKPREGDQVEADFKGKGKYYAGKVTRVRSDGTYDIEYEDGDSEKRVELKRIKVKGGARSRSRSRSRSPKRGRKLREGAKIEARYRLAPARKITEFCRHHFNPHRRKK